MMHPVLSLRVLLAVILLVVLGGCYQGGNPNDRIEGIREGLQLATAGHHQAVESMKKGDDRAVELRAASTHMIEGSKAAQREMDAMRGMHDDGCGFALEHALGALGDAAMQIDELSVALERGNDAAFEAMDVTLTAATEALAEADESLECVAARHLDDDERRREQSYY